MVTVVDSSLTIVSWNVRGIRGVGSHKLERQAAGLAAHGPDVVVLTEVRSHGDLAERLREQLAGIGLDDFLFSGPQPPTENGKPYGNVIASRWPLELLSWPEVTTWPQLIIVAQIDWRGSPVMIVGAHIPNGSGNGWEKVYALEALASGLVRAVMPTILAGDFNEPKRFHPSVLSFGADRRGRLDGAFTDLHGVTDDRRRWQDAVEKVLTPRSREDGGWGGRHVVLQAGGDFETTHLAGGRYARCFDHILTEGPLLRVRAVAYDHAVREGTSPLSDHSMIAASIESTRLGSR